MNEKEFKEYVEKMNKNIGNLLKDNDEELAFYIQLVARFNDICEENKELKEQLSGTTFCYDEEDHRRLKDKIVELERTIELSYVDAKETLATINYEQEAQQKEFIKYLEDEINNCTKQNDIFFVGMQNDIFFVGIQRAFKLSLQKYKEIIGGKNERI